MNSSQSTNKEFPSNLIVPNNDTIENFPDLLFIEIVKRLPIQRTKILNTILKNSWYAASIKLFESIKDNHIPLYILKKYGKFVKSIDEYTINQTVFDFDIISKYCKNINTVNVLSLNGEITLTTEFINNYKIDCNCDRVPDNLNNHICIKSSHFLEYCRSNKIPIFSIYENDPNGLVNYHVLRELDLRQVTLIYEEDTNDVIPLPYLPSLSRIQISGNYVPAFKQLSYIRNKQNIRYFYWITLEGFDHLINEEECNLWLFTDLTTLILNTNVYFCTLIMHQTLPFKKLKILFLNHVTSDIIRNVFNNCPVLSKFMHRRVYVSPDDCIIPKKLKMLQFSEYYDVPVIENLYNKVTKIRFSGNRIYLDLTQFPALIHVEIITGFHIKIFSIFSKVKYLSIRGQGFNFMGLTFYESIERFFPELELILIQILEEDLRSTLTRINDIFNTQKKLASIISLDVFLHEHVDTFDELSNLRLDRKVYQYLQYSLLLPNIPFYFH